MRSTTCKNFQTDGRNNHCVRIEKKPQGILMREDLIITPGEEKKYCLNDYRRCPRFEREQKKYSATDENN